MPAAAEAILRSDSSDQEYIAVYGPHGRLLAGDAELHPDSVAPGQPSRISDGLLHGKKIRKASYRLDTPKGVVDITVAETVNKRKHNGAQILAAIIAPNVLHELLRENASTWYDLALLHDIDLGFELEEARTEGSEWLLRELLANLVDNALKYTPPGGQVTARTGIDGLHRPFVEIEDNGPGIPASERQRIFDRFYRAEDTPGSGTGFGLAIVKEVAGRHRAAIDLSNTDALGGTRIRVSFPADLAQGQPRL